MKIDAFGQSDRGLVREKNEDALFIDSENKVFAVADGLGGLPRGDDASDLAVRMLEAYFQETPGENGSVDFNTLFQTINETVYREGRSGSGEIGMGTTLTTAKLSRNLMHIGHVGDTAIIRFRSNHWDQITTDHTMEQEIRERLQPGEDAFIPDYFSHTLTRCIGQAEVLAADVLQVEIEEGDRFLICSDGVTKVLKAEELHRLSQSCEDPKSFVEGIIMLANNRGGPDNITAIALFAE